MAKKPRTIDEYLDGVPDDKRAALEKLRSMIKSVAPKAEETISYGMPAFRLDGKVIGGFAAWANHCAFYPWSSRIISEHKKDLAKYDTSKGTIRFTPDKPLPAALVRKLVKAHIAQNAKR